MDRETNGRTDKRTDEQTRKHRNTETGEKRNDVARQDAQTNERTNGDAYPPFNVKPQGRQLIKKQTKKQRTQPHVTDAAQA